MREIKLARTVWANMELAKICPGNDLGRIKEVLDTSDSLAQMQGILKIITILSEAYERKEKAQNPNYEPHPITEDELIEWTEDEIGAALNQALETFHKDGEQTVVAQPKKSKKKVTK